MRGEHSSKKNCSKSCFDYDSTARAAVNCKPRGSGTSSGCPWVFSECPWVSCQISLGFFQISLGILQISLGSVNVFQFVIVGVVSKLTRRCEEPSKHQGKQVYDSLNKPSRAGYPVRGGQRSLYNFFISPLHPTRILSPVISIEP